MQEVYLSSTLRLGAIFRSYSTTASIPGCQPGDFGSNPNSFTMNKLWTYKNIQLAEKEGSLPDFEFFWGFESMFSQWYPSEFQVGGNVYKTAEHFMMAEKARLFKDRKSWELILKSPTPKEAKSIGRKVNNFDQATWDQNKFRLVTTGSVAKFMSTRELKSKLVKTRDKILVEASPYDKIWGIGMSSDNPMAKVPSQWNGENLLGLSLMRARYMLS